MALNQPRNWLVSYDIADPRRLHRVHRLLSARAVPVQYSVFATRASSAKLGELRAELSRLIHRAEDDVRIYPIPEPAELVVYGRKAVPDGVAIIAGETTLRLAPFARDAMRATIAEGGAEAGDGGGSPQG
jgi:CRISPR-associated protein Cas2